ncbi:MAG: AAA family ATPase [Anaerolineae bacterium]|nr:AAA family ATPase [Anaerolineae bacterium]
MSDTLALDSLEIKNFRAFKYLRIERLARVNLIVGKNNVGKTSLLEAVRFFADRGAPQDLLGILETREEAMPSRATIYNSDREDPSIRAEILQAVEAAISTLFYGRKSSAETRFDIGSLTTPENQITVRIVRQPRLSRGRQLQVSEQSLTNRNLDQVEDEPAIKINFGKGEEIETGYFALDRLVNRLSPRLYSSKSPSFFIPAIGLSNLDLERLWSEISLRPAKEQETTTALKIVDSRVERIDFFKPRDSRESIPRTLLKNNSEPIPLKSLGEGMNRILGLAMALVNAKDTVLIVDEIDTGLHYSILAKVWKLIFETARRLNVQVFATTHSKDCIEAFEQAIRENNFDDGQVIKLHAKENEPGEVEAIVIDKDILAVAMQEDLEVRD